MIGSSRVQVLIDQSKQLYESSLKFAKFDSPDFIIMREAVLCFEKIVTHKMEGDRSITEEDKKYLYTMVSVISRTFGTSDLEWYCAAESVINVLFNIKSRNSHEYAKFFLDQIVRKMFRFRSEQEIEEIRKS